MVCKADYNFDDYVYPFGFRTYYSENSSGKTASASQFRFESQYYDKFLVEETYIGLGMKSATTFYRYQIQDNVVVSDVQIYQNVLTGSTQYQDILIIFAFPKGNKPYKWTESNRGDTYQCTSEYVYLNASIYHNSFFTKAIKITRDLSYLSGNEQHRVIERSYWVGGYGRIITLTNWDGEERTSSKLDILDYFQEMSQESYNAYMKKKEDEAIMRRKIEAFNEANKPQSFKQKYPNYQQQVISVIESHINMLGTIGKEPMVVTIVSSKDVRIQEGAFSAAPIIGQSVKEYLEVLLKEGKVRLDTLINPETNKSVEIPLVLEVNQIPVIETKFYSLDYKNGTWYETGSKKPFYRNSTIESEILKSAEEFRSSQKRAKKINVSVNFISFNNKLFLQRVGKAYIRKD